MKEVRRNRDVRDRERRDDRVVRRAPEKRRVKFNWEPPTQEDMERHANRRTSTYDSIFSDKFREWRAKTGDNTVRILPPTWTRPDGKRPHYGWEFWGHQYVGSDGGSYACPRKMLGKRCPICEAHKLAVKDGDEDEARKLAVRNLFAYWIIDREADSANRNKPQIWTVSNIRDKEIMGITQDRKKRSFIFIQAPDDGYDLSFKREGTGLNTKYISYQFDRDPSPISQDQDVQDDILEFITENPLPDCVHWYDVDYLDDIMFGTANDARDADLEDDDEEPPRRRGHEDEPEEEDQEEETDETDEHEGSESDEESGEEEDEEERGDETEEETTEEADEEEEPDEDEPDVAPRARRRVPEREPIRAGNGRNRDSRKPERERERERPRGTTIARKGKDRPERTYRK